MGYCPIEFKKAVVMPIYRKGDNKQMTNYQPTSLISLSPKVLKTQMMKNIFNAIDERKPNLCVFLDLAKALDTEPHSQLLEILEDTEIRGIYLNLF